MKKFLNPFDYVAGATSLLWGLAAMVASAAVAALTDQSFDGFMHMTFARISIWQALAQQLICWLLLATLLYGAARLASRSSVRALDIYGTNLFARIPWLLMLAAEFIPGKGLLTRLESGNVAEIQAAIVPLTIYGLILIVLLVWSIWWSYKAFSISANLRGWKAAAIFIACWIAVSIAVTPLLALTR